jgi:hypothetical protein
LAVAVDAGPYEAGGRHDIQDDERGKESQRYRRAYQFCTYLKSGNEGFLNRCYSNRPNSHHPADIDGQQPPVTDRYMAAKTPTCAAVSPRRLSGRLKSCSKIAFLTIIHK